MCSCINANIALSLDLSYLYIVHIIGEGSLNSHIVFIYYKFIPCLHSIRANLAKTSRFYVF